MYLGAHYLSDVLGGYLLGLLWLIIGICIRELRFLPPVKPPVLVLQPREIKIYTAVILAAVCGFYVYSGYYFHPTRFFPEEEQSKVMTGDNIMRIFTVYRLPGYTESITGEKQQPLSLIITARDSEAMTEAFKKAGWQKADPVNLVTLAKTADSFLFNESYPLAPITPSFWNEKVNDLNFVKTKPETAVRKRHEARFWRTNYITADGRRIYVGTAVFSESPSRRIIPGMGPDLDKEREGLFSNLVLSGEVEAFTRLRFVPPMSGRSFTGNPFHTDGYLYLIYLK
jgi:undecaprenyl-diphosphatase